MVVWVEVGGVSVVAKSGPNRIDRTLLGGAQFFAVWPAVGFFQPSLLAL